MDRPTLPNTRNPYIPDIRAFTFHTPLFVAHAYFEHYSPIRGFTPSQVPDSLGGWEGHTGASTSL